MGTKNSPGQFDCYENALPDEPIRAASDPFAIIVGIRQFGLAPDGSDLRDLEAALRSAVPVLSEDAIARIIVGPREPVPPSSPLTLAELQDIRWSRASEQDRREARWIARAIIDRLTGRSEGR